MISATACASSSSARSRPTWTPGTRPAPSRASCTARPRTSACSASATPKSTAARRPTWSTRLIDAEEMARAGSGGLMASLFSHNIGLPPVLAHGSEALKRRVVPPVLRGEKIAALAITEPGGGSDVAALRTTRAARRRPLRHRRREDLHHLGHARRLDHASRCAPAANRARAASRCCWSTATRRACRARRWTRWAGGPATPRTCTSTAAACRRPT